MLGDHHEGSITANLLRVALQGSKVTTRQSTMLVFSALLLLAVQRCDAFSISSSGVRRPTCLRIIRATDSDYKPDPKLTWGVDLTNEKYLELTGVVKHAPGEADAEMEQLSMYNKLTRIASQVNDCGVTILATGTGKENYVKPTGAEDPVVYYGPMEAVKDSLHTAASAMAYDKIFINFIGGNLISKQVLDACEHLVLSLDIKTKAKVFFSSVSHDEFPQDTVAVTVLGAMKEQAIDDWSGTKKSIAKGKLYVDMKGNTWTLTEEELFKL